MDESKRDLEALQGVWEQIGHEADGLINPYDQHGGPGALTTISGHHFSVETAQGELLLQGAFSLDASVTPKAIDWMDSIGPDRGKSLPAAYTLDGDHFVFIAADEGCPRPTVFRTVPGQTMRTFRRVLGASRAVVSPD
jgi:uncharacterized protein (TIGR03067 family)